MKVEVMREFQWAPDGNHVRVVRVGEVLEGRGAAVALEQSAGREITGSSSAPRLAPPGPKDMPAVLRLPPIEEYVARGYTRESYSEFIVNQAVRAGKEGGAVAILAATELDRDGASPESAPQATVPPAPMPTPDVAAKGEEPQPQAQGPKAPEVTEPPGRKELERLTQQELLAVALSRGLTVEADTGKGKLLKLLTAQ